MEKPKKHRSIRTISIIFILLSILLPLVITNSFFYITFTQTFNKDHEEAIKLNTHALNQSLEQYLDKYSTVFDVLSHNQVWEELTDINETLTTNEVKEYYNKLSLNENVSIYQEHASFYETLVQEIDAYEENTEIRAIYIGTPSKYVFTNDKTNGYTVLYGYNDGIDTTTFDCTTRPWYLGAAENQGEIYWSTPYLDKDGESIVLSASKAIYDDNNQLIAVISMDILSEEFVDNILNFQADHIYDGFIMDKDGTYIFASSNQIGTKTDNQDLITFLSTDQDNIELGDFVYTKSQNNISNWLVIYTYSQSQLNQDLLSLTANVLFLSIAMLIFAIFAVAISISYYINPIINLTNHFIQMETSNNINEKLPSLYTNKHNEIGRLYQSINTFKNSLIKSQNKVDYLIYHDTLTNTTNRTYFEHKLKELNKKEALPLSIAMIDLNGLKLINDTFGHDAGDDLLRVTGQLLKSHTRDTDCVSRWGGDEFVVLFPNTNNQQAKEIMQSIQESASKKKYKFGELSMSYGVATKDKITQKFDNTFKIAEELMYQAKTDVISSVRSETLNTILNTLFEKSPETEQHSRRVSKLATMIAEEMGFKENKINEIKTMGMIHDIGKIVIDSSILEKKGPITKEERKIIETHSLIGSRILSSTNKHTRLIPGILHHHEKVDGSGYPDGLKGEDIPLESRIISVADAFDAMTSIRPYKSTPLTVGDAKRELKKCSGTQFDKKIVDIFITKVIPRLKED